MIHWSGKLIYSLIFCCLLVSWFVRSRSLSPHRGSLSSSLDQLISFQPLPRLISYWVHSPFWPLQVHFFLFLSPDPALLSDSLQWDLHIGLLILWLFMANSLSIVLLTIYQLPTSQQPHFEFSWYWYSFGMILVSLAELGMTCGVEMGLMILKCQWSVSWLVSMPEVAMLAHGIMPYSANEVYALKQHN